MTDASSASSPAARVAVVVGLVGLAFAVPPVLKAARQGGEKGNKDYSLWFAVGQSVRAGEPLYRCVDSFEVRYTYPPPLAVLVFAPLAGLGYAGFVAACALTNTAAWAACAWLVPRLVAEPGERALWPAAAIPAAATAAYVWDTFHLGQVNLILLLLAVLAWAALRRGRPVLAGAALGLAVAVKVFPLPVVVYFAFRRQWAAVATTAVTCGLVLGVLPGAVRGFERNGRELGQWVGLMVGDQSGATMAARSSIGFTWRNSSLVSVAHRLLRPVDAGERAGVPFRVNVADLTPGRAQAAGFAGCVLLGGVLLWATRLRFAPTPAAEGLEWGMVLALVVLCSPLSWTYFFCWLLPAWAAAARFCLSERYPPSIRRRAAWVCAAAGLLLGSAATQVWDPLLSAVGVTTWGAVVLALVLAGMRRCHPGQTTLGVSRGPAGE
jgi:hypothetical protein